MRGFGACVVVAMAATGAWAAPAPSIATAPGEQPGAALGDAFEMPRLEWEPMPGETHLVALTRSIGEADAPQWPAGPAPIMIPTPGTAALAALAGLVIILPRKRG